MADFLVPGLGFIALLLVFSAFLSGSETALTAVSRARMHQMEKEGSRGAQRVNALLSDRGNMIGAILLGNTFTSILASSLATALLAARFGDRSVAITTIVMTFVVLVFAEILPNVVSTVIVLLPLMIATTILTESALSYLSVGVQPPNVSWGTIISDGQDLLYTRPWVSLAPGIMIVLTVLALNVLGDGVRDALDPRAKVRV